MSWGDIFYPDNPKRREDVVRMTTKLKTLMEGNFDATNDLIDLLNKHVKPNPMLEHIRVDDTATIKANADVIIACISQIQTIVDEFDKTLSEKLDPELYRKLSDPNTGFKETLATAKKAVSATIGLAATVASIAVIIAIKTGAILVKVVTSIGVLATSVIAGVVLGVLALGIDMIASAIIGAIERDELEKTIKELEDALSEFEPASKEYTKTIVHVEVKLQIILED